MENHYLMTLGRSMSWQRHLIIRTVVALTSGSLAVTLLAGVSLNVSLAVNLAFAADCITPVTSRVVGACDVAMNGAAAATLDPETRDRWFTFAVPPGGARGDITVSGLGASFYAVLYEPDSVATHVDQFSDGATDVILIEADGSPLTLQEGRYYLQLYAPPSGGSPVLSGQIDLALTPIVPPATPPSLDPGDAAVAFNILLRERVPARATNFSFDLQPGQVALFSGGIFQTATDGRTWRCGTAQVCTLVWAATRQQRIDLQQLVPLNNWIGVSDHLSIEEAVAFKRASYFSWPNCQPNDGCLSARIITYVDGAYQRDEIIQRLASDAGTACDGGPFLARPANLIAVPECVRMVFPSNQDTTVQLTWTNSSITRGKGPYSGLALWTNYSQHVELNAVFPDGHTCSTQNPRSIAIQPGTYSLKVKSAKQLPFIEVWQGEVKDLTPECS